MKINDPIVQDVRSVREKLFSAYDGDMNKLLDYYHDQEKLDKDRLVKNKNEKREDKPTPGVAGR